MSDAGLVTGKRRQMLLLALPILGGMASQNILNLVDVAMVGYLGDSALAATGMGSFANFIAVSVLMGMATGVQAISARRVGEGRLDEVAVPLNGGLLLSLLIGAPVAIALWHAAPAIFPILVDDPEVVKHGVPYLQMRLLALPSVGMNFAFRGYWNGVNRSGNYMRTLLVMHLANIALNWLLIYGKLGFPAMGTAGSGLATSLASWLGIALYMAQGWWEARPGGFLRRLPGWTDIATMARLALPAGLQQLFFAAGMTALFRIVALVGTAELAAANVLVNLLLVAILPGLAFGLTSASLVGQSLGRRDPDGAYREAWEVSKLAAVVVGVLALPAVFAPDLLLRPFLHDASTRALAEWPLRIVGLAMSLDTVGLVMLSSLQGAGDSRRTMAVAVVMQWVIFLPAAYLIGPVLGLGLVGIWGAQVAYRGVQALLFVYLWRGGAWRAIRL